jgi:2'-5' RNA ligase
MKRLFVAVKIHPSPELLQVYYGLRKDLALEKIKWVEENNLHFTLKFIGNTYPSQVVKIIEALETVASDASSFEMIIRDVGIFGSRYNPRVIWLGIENNPQLVALANGVLDGLDAAGFLRDRQNFVPHLTIGRIKYIRNKKHLRNTIEKYHGKPLQKVIIKEFYLYESILMREGPVYKVIKKFILR